MKTAARSGCFHMCLSKKNLLELHRVEDLRREVIDAERVTLGVALRALRVVVVIALRRTDDERKRHALSRLFGHVGIGRIRTAGGAFGKHGHAVRSTADGALLRLAHLSI